MHDLLDQAQRILDSETFKESRSKKYIKAVPEEVWESNLWIHNKARKLNPEILDKVESKLQKDYEKLIDEID